jgi:rhodanese-related sulfurtransferase
MSPEFSLEFIQQNWYWAALAVVSGGMLIFTSVKGGAKGISPQEATQLINREDALVLDVRESSEFAAGHILNARHIPLADLEKRLADLEKFKDKPIIVNCQSGARSETACATLAKAGFGHVLNLSGGIAAWQDAGMPVSRKKK